MDALHATTDVGRGRGLRGWFVLAGLAFALSAIEDSATEEEDTPTEEIVVWGEKSEPRPIQSVVMEYLPRPRVVLVGIDEQRNVSMVSALENAVVGEPPWGPLEDHVQKLCVENRFRGEAGLYSRGSRRTFDKRRLVQRLPFTSDLDDVVWIEYRCSGKKLPPVDVVALAWRLSEEEKTQLNERDSKYIEDLSWFAYELDMPRPPQAGLSLLLGEGDNAAKRYVVDMVKSLKP